MDIRGVNSVEALARFSGNAERYRHWVLEFVEFGPAVVREIKAAITAKDRDKARHLTHGLKGRAAILGMSEIQSIASSLELALRNGEPLDLWLDELEETCTEMVQEIQRSLAT